MCSFCTLLNALVVFFFFFFFNDTATTEIYTLSLHDALPISAIVAIVSSPRLYNTTKVIVPVVTILFQWRDRKSTRLNSSHLVISYAVFCLKKKKKNTHHHLCSSMTQSSCA